MGKKIRLTIEPEKGHTPEEVRDEAMDKLKEVDSVHAANSVVGFIGSPKRRNFKVEKEFDKRR